jgi:hypothetical protein
MIHAYGWWSWWRILVLHFSWFRNGTDRNNKDKKKVDEDDAIVDDSVVVDYDVVVVVAVVVFVVDEDCKGVASQWHESVGEELDEEETSFLFVDDKHA